MSYDLTNKAHREELINMLNENYANAEYFQSKIGKSFIPIGKIKRYKTLFSAYKNAIIEYLKHDIWIYLNIEDKLQLDPDIYTQALKTNRSVEEYIGYKYPHLKNQSIPI